MKRLLRILYPLLTVSSLAFIWSNSLLSGERASLKTGSVIRILEGILRFFWGEEASLPEWLRAAVPKIGHFAEFFLFALFLSLSFYVWKEALWRNPYPVFFFGALAGMTDEWLQTFSFGRGSRVSDVFIDLGGVMAGYFLCRLCLCILKKRRNRNGGIASDS